MEQKQIDANAPQSGCFKGEYTRFLEEELKRATDIDWQKYRMEVAKEMLAAFLSNPDRNVYSGSCESQAKDAVSYADALIAELKKNEK